MSRLTSTLFVTQPGASVGVRGGSLMVRRPDRTWSRVPMEGLDGVILVGGVSISSEAIARCVRAGIRVASLTRGGKTRFICEGATSGNVHLRIAQLRRAESAEESLEVARVIVAGKLRNSLRLVQRWSWDADPPESRAIDSAREGLRSCLERVGSAPSADHIRGVEGDGARWTFKALGAHLSVLGPPFTLERRSRRPPADPVNAALSFGYGLLTAELFGAADAVGLDPQIGFLHRVRAGRPALALDVLEEFRAQIVDRFVAGALRRRQLRLEHFTETPGGGWYLSDDGRKEYLALFDEFRSTEVEHALSGRSVTRSALPLVQMTVMARFVRGELPSYVPWQGA